MTDSDLTVSILREIRDEIRTTNQRIDTTNQRIDALNTNLSGRLDQTNARLDETNVRLGVVEHVVTDAATQILLLSRYVKNKHEDAIDDLRERVTRLEAKSTG